MCRYRYKNRKAASKELSRTKRIGNMSKVINIPVAGILLMTGMIVMGVTYVKTVNVIATTGYEMTEHQIAIQALKQENEKLSVETSKFSSLDRVNAVSTSRGLVEAPHIEYLSEAGTVAVAR